MSSVNVTQLYLDFEALQEDYASFKVDVDAFWLMFGAVLVFFMQTGFGMLEVGCIQWKNVKNILIKNVFDASLGAIVWWSIGFGVAMGKDDYVSDGSNGFIGRDLFFMTTDTFRGGPNSDKGYAWAGWLFQWAFAATTATIVTGSVAERITFSAYLVYAFCLVSFVYPCVVHWGWNANGWASAWREEDLLFGCGVLDFAGSGVVHTTGGVVALWGAKILGPRTGRFINGQKQEFKEVSPIYQTLGTLILWFGWYGFNGASTLYIGGYSAPAARAMVTSTISAGAGCISSVLLAKLHTGIIDPGAANNGILGGLVSITASCSVVDPEAAFVIGLIGGVIYYFSALLLLRLQIDDVVNASPVHMFCGVWGVLASGLFASEAPYGAAYYSARQSKCAGAFYGGDGSQFAANLAFILAVLAWSTTWGCIIFFACDKIPFIGLRVDLEVEEMGMDSSKHGGAVDGATQKKGEGLA
mmetsp:Transcript_28080/g.41750  ORF Transcript_28080/g.41750 Transcript_28080/m.41750 type:complete len:470 (-) Transcript_28080:339-1748(-)